MPVSEQEIETDYGRSSKVIVPAVVKCPSEIILIIVVVNEVSLIVIGLVVITGILIPVVVDDLRRLALGSESPAAETSAMAHKIFDSLKKKSSTGHTSRCGHRVLKESAAGRCGCLLGYRGGSRKTGRGLGKG